MKLAYSASLFISICMALLLTGCGAGGTSPVTKNVLDQSAHCINCHQSVKSHVTGESIVEEWKRSTHMTANGAGCSDCHDDGYSHSPYTESCNKCHNSQSINPTNNPDRDGKCSKCHNKTSGFRTTNVDGIAINTGSAHFTNLTTGTIRRVSQSLYYTNYTSSYRITSASGGTGVFASTLYNPVKGDATKYGCRACHNPHDTSSQIDFHRMWSRSGHGDTNSGSRTSRYFKAFGSNFPASDTMENICVRCHTSTGFINYVKSDFTTVKALDTVNTADHTKELIGCNVCHDDGAGNSYSYKLRNVLATNPGRTGVPAFYNYSPARGGNARAIPGTNIKVALTYPDAASSNICIVCHMGREIGQSVKNAYLQGINFTNTARISAHDFAAGANLFQESGFEFYTSVAKYPQTAFLHNQAGLGINGTGSKGPCITCHMSRPLTANGNKSPDSHTFLPITKLFNGNGTIETISSTACDKCHTEASSAKPMDVDRLNTNRRGFVAAMAFLRDLIDLRIDRTTVNPITRAVSYGTSSAPPNWLKTCVPTATTMADDILQLGSGTTLIGKGAYTMGAAFNYELLYADFGAFVHNPNYVKRLIFDSIDWLNDCSMTTSNGALECAGISDPLAKAYLCPTGVRP